MGLLVTSMDMHPLDDAADQPRPALEAELPSNPEGLSKKAQKRAAKAARLHELKLERRTREKEAKKHRRRERAKAVASAGRDQSNSQKKGRETEIFNARIVIDLGFDELMSDKEISSLTSQLAYAYSANRHAAHAFSVLLFTSLSGRTKQRLDSMNDAGYRRWSRTDWWEEGYDRLWTKPPQPLGEESDTQDRLAGPTDVVYLTADSPEELLELHEGETYIIGGICDRNRYKNLCLNKAVNSQVRHARLPINRYISLTTRKVLTVNQVFEILLKWIDSRSWEEAFWAVIPKRKFQEGLHDQRPVEDIGGRAGNSDASAEGNRSSEEKNR